MAIQYNSNYDGTMPFSDVCGQVGLNVGVEETMTLPGDSQTTYSVFFSYNSVSNIFVGLNVTPVVPTLGTVGTQPYNTYRPYKKLAHGGDVLHFITPDATAYCGFSVSKTS